MTLACQLLLPIFTKLAAWMTWVEGQNCIFFALVNITDLCVVLVSRFWHAEFLFHVEYNVLSLRRNWVCSYEFFSARTDLAVKLLTLHLQQELHLRGGYWLRGGSLALPPAQINFHHCGFTGIAGTNMVVLTLSLSHFDFPNNENCYAMTFEGVYSRCHILSLFCSPTT